MILTLLLPRAPYLLPSHVTVDVMRQPARNADYQHLQEPDLLWTGAILADQAQKDRQGCPLRDRDFLLGSTIEMGLSGFKPATYCWVDNRGSVGEKGVGGVGLAGRM